jgi:hypothetical protein
MTKGLRHRYLYGLAIDSGDPNNVIVSASYGPMTAYYVGNAESFVYRKSNDGEEWKVVSSGLPEPSGTTIATLASNPKVAGEFYAVNNHGYLSPLIPVYLGRDLIFYGLKNIFHKSPEHLQSFRDD